MLHKQLIMLGALMMPVMAFADLLSPITPVDQYIEPIDITTTSIGGQHLPNLYELKNGSIKIIYSTSGNDGQPHLSYKKGKIQRSFSGEEIRTIETDLGTVVSVTTVMSVDTGSTSFSVLIPKVNLDNTRKPAKIATQGIETIHKFSIIPAFNKGQMDTYKTFLLTGTGAIVMY
jgi:hypothetical protein